MGLWITRPTPFTSALFPATAGHLQTVEPLAGCRCRVQSSQVCKNYCNILGNVAKLQTYTLLVESRCLAAVLAVFGRSTRIV